MGLTNTDLFAGAGGSSTGMVAAGVEVRIAANHWDLACSVHQANHPTTDHAIADIHQANPHFFPKTDTLWASPECTKWTVASGRAAADLEPALIEDPLADEAAQRSRMLMYDVPRFTEVHQYRAVMVENVVDVATRPKYKNAFDIWLHEMTKLGYDHRVISLNSMHAQTLGMPAPQSRDRLYVGFWRRGDKPIDFEPALRPSASCPRCDQVVEARQAWKPGRSVGKYRQQYIYVCGSCGTAVEPGWLPAASAIDWAIPGLRFGDKPRAPKTRARVAAGIARYWLPLIVEAGGHTYDAADPKHPQYGHPDAYYRAWPVDHPLRALHGTATKALATRDAYALVSPYYGNSSEALPIERPLGTLTTHDKYALIMRNFTARGSQGQMTTPAHEPLRTLTTQGNQSLITPGDMATAEAMVDDCRFRMLEPHEVAAGMAFPDSYQWQGSKRNRVKMSGNAVTPPTARDLMSCVVEALGGGQ